MGRPFWFFFQFSKRDVLQTLKCTVTFWPSPPIKGVVMKMEIEAPAIAILLGVRHKSVHLKTNWQVLSGCLVYNVISKAGERLWLTSISGINKYKVGTVGMSSCTMQSYGLGNDHFPSGVQSVSRVYLSTRSKVSWDTTFLVANFSRRPSVVWSMQICPA